MFLANVKELRSDLSDWLVHFTTGTNDQAEATLTTILSEAKLRSSHDLPSICFSEAPLGELNKLFQLYREYPEPRFAPFGIAVPKTWLFERGGRPVIYGLAAERDRLPEAYRFRHVTYNPPNYDFTWQREWRIATDQLLLEPASTLVILPTDEAAYGLTHDIGVDYEYEGPGEFSETCLPHSSLAFAFTRSRLPAWESHPDLLIAKSIKEQELNEPEA